MRRIQTDDAPSPGGHSAQGVSHGGSLFVSGQLPIDPQTGEKKTGAIEEQTRQVLENVLAVVVASGGDKSHIVKTTVYVSDIELWVARQRSLCGVLRSLPAGESDCARQRAPLRLSDRGRSRRRAPVINVVETRGGVARFSIRALRSSNAWVAASWGARPWF